MNLSAPPRHRALLSAHRAAAAEVGLLENSVEALEAAVAAPVQFVEFDVVRTRDGHYVLRHDAKVRHGRFAMPVSALTLDQVEQHLGHRLVRYEDALALLATHGKKAHIDLKFTSPEGAYRQPEATWELEAAETALRIMGDPSDFIITTMEDASVAVLASWADQRSPGTLVGLSLGRDVFHLNPVKALRLRLSEVFPSRRIRSCRANLVVCNYRLARLNVLRWAHRHGLPVLVWTVDSHGPLARFVADHRVWMVTSNYPSRIAANIAGPTEPLAA